MRVILQYVMCGHGLLVKVLLVIWGRRCKTNIKPELEGLRPSESRKGNLSVQCSARSRSLLVHVSSKSEMIALGMIDHRNKSPETGFASRADPDTHDVHFIDYNQDPILRRSS
jgi:hypothetical protein